MELKEGDLIITLLKVEKIQAIIGQLKAGQLGVVSMSDPKFNDTKVYGVIIEGQEYFLFEDEIEKVEGKC